MSRVGKQILDIPAKTEVTVGESIVVKGPLGELSRPNNKKVTVSVDDGKVSVKPTKPDDKLSYALWGTYTSHIQNMIQGVNEPYQKQLEIEGVGFRAAMAGNVLELNVGFSHQVKMEVPQGLEVTVEKNLITVKGIDKEAVGQFAAEIRATKPPEPYKGKGIHYLGEYIIRKQGKKAA